MPPICANSKQIRQNQNLYKVFRHRRGVLSLRKILEANSYQLIKANLDTQLQLITGIPFQFKFGHILLSVPIETYRTRFSTVSITPHSDYEFTHDMELTLLEVTRLRIARRDLCQVSDS